jgi:hypothetical protein
VAEWLNVDKAGCSPVILDSCSEGWPRHQSSGQPQVRILSFSAKQYEEISMVKKTVKQALIDLINTLPDDDSQDIRSIVICHDATTHKHLSMEITYVDWEEETESKYKHFHTKKITVPLEL